jgi:hypothetical protein
MCINVGYLGIFILVIEKKISFVDWTHDEIELVENNRCTLHLNPCVPRKEDNYFYTLSKYQHKLEQPLTRNPNFVRPSYCLHGVRLYYVYLFSI